MSFWNQCPGPTWSDCFWSLCSCGGLPIAQPIRREALPRPIAKTETADFLLADHSHTDEIVKFLEENFRITETSKCSLPVERLKQGLRSDWIFIFAKDKESKKIIATVASRLLGTLVFHVRDPSGPKTSTFSNADYIDFFCVHPDYRKGGVGSDLLKYIDYYSCQKGRPIHFFQKEISPLFVIPPLWAGTYIARETSYIGHSNQRIQYIPIPKIIPSSDTFSITFRHNQLSQDSRYMRYDCGNFKLYVAITNTYHMYKNSWMGEVLFYHVESNEPIEKSSIAAAMEEVIDSSSFKYILMDESIPHLKQMNWKKDAPYYIYAYNANPRNFFSVKPNFWF